MKYFLLLLIPFFCTQMSSQNSSFKKVSMNVRKIFRDHESNVYVLEDNTLIKFGQEGKQLARWTPESGEFITDIDVKDPFKILIYFGRQNIVLFLDNNLTVMSNEISVDLLNIFGRSLIIRSEFGGFWIWDEENSELLKLNADFDLEYKKFIPVQSEIVQLATAKNKLLFRSSDGNLFLFNSLTSAFSELNEYSENPVTVSSGMFLFFDKKSQSFFVYQDERFVKKNQSISFPENVKPENSILTDKYVICFDDESLYFIPLQ